MNIANKGLLAIEVDFLARALERILHAIATKQSLPHLRLAPLCMSNCKEQTACVSWTRPSRHAPKMYGSGSTQRCNPHPSVMSTNAIFGGHARQQQHSYVLVYTASIRHHTLYVHAHISTTHAGTPRVSYGSVAYQVWYATNAAKKQPRSICHSPTPCLVQTAGWKTQ